MKKGLNFLGEYKSSKLYIDLNYLKFGFGIRKRVEQVENMVGWALIGIVVVTITFATFFEVFFSNYFILTEPLKVDQFSKLLLYLGVGGISYAVFLLRDRSVFLDRYGTKSLEDLKNNLDEKIDITTYLDNDLVNIFDEVFTETTQDSVIKQLTSQLVKLWLVKVAGSRLGIEDVEFPVLIDKLSAMKQDSTNLAPKEDMLNKILKESFVLALENDFTKIDELVIFIHLCLTDLKQPLLEMEVGENEVKAMLLWAQNLNKRTRYLEIIKKQSILKPSSTVNRTYTSVFSPNLVKYSRDFTAEIIRGDFELSYAREGELSQLVEMVTAGESSASLVLGQPGVGKTTFIKNLGIKMVIEDVPKVIQDMRLVGFDFNRAYAMAKGEQQFKADVGNILQEVAKAGNIILVIDDLDELVGVRKELSAEIVNLLTDALDVHKIRIVATSSVEGYTRYIKPFKALDAIFSKMTMEVPSDEVAQQILFDFVPTFEKEYEVKIAFEAVDRVVELAHQFAFERVLPDKAINLMEEAISKVLAEGKTTVDKEVIDKLVATKVGVEVGTISSEESDFLTKLEEELHKRIIGQHQAVVAVASALRRSRAGLTSRSRPIASFLFFGPTGVGKTELAKTVAETYFGDEGKMIRLDMSEYHEDANLSRLIGYQSSSGFTGGFLTEAVRSKPYSLILLDEIEKANPRVLDLFLQILDEGKMKDGMGREVVFTNTIIIATSNIASKEIADLISQGRRYRDVVEAILPALRQYLRIEFLNRFDKLIMFKPLLRIEVEEIANLMMKSVAKKMKDQGIMLEYSPYVLKELVTMGFDELYGARELRRIVTDKIEDLVATLIIEKKIKSGDKLFIESIDNYKIN